MLELYIIGAGGLGKEVKALIQNINAQKQVYNIAGFIDDYIPSGTMINQLEVKGDIGFLNKIDYPFQAVIAIGNASSKENIFKRIANKNISFPVLIDPKAIIMEKEYVHIGEGSIISANTIITTNVNIGKHVFVNLNCTIGHDCEINDFVSVMPFVNISGGVEINNTTYIGTGAIILNLLKIGRYTTIGAGAVVTKSIPEKVTVVGIPAKIING